MVVSSVTVAERQPMKMSFSICVALLASWTSLASAQVAFQEKFPEDTKFKLHSEQKTSQTLTLAGMNIETSSTVFSVETRTIGSRGADGSIPMSIKMDSLQSDISLPQGLSIKFDSSNPDQKASNPLLEPVMEILRTTSRVPINVQFDSANHVSSASIPAADLEKLSDATKTNFSPENLNKILVQERSFLPDEPVKIGEKWERTVDSYISEGQSLSFRILYEYVGAIQQDGKTLDKITSKTLDVSYSVDGNPVLQVKNSDLKVKESAGEFLFDRQLGASVSRKSKVQVVGKLTLVIANMEFPGELDLTMDQQVTREK